MAAQRVCKHVHVKVRMATDRLACSLPSQDGGEGSVDASSDDFDTLVFGPWMDNWEITHSNRHTEAWTALEAAQR